MLTLVALLCGACHDDPEPETPKEPKSLLEGEWLEYTATPYTKGYSAVTFNGDGTFVQDMELVSNYDKVAYEKLKGEMFIEEGGFALQFLNHEGLQQTDEYEIKELTPTHLVTWLPAVSGSDEFVRIKATKNVSVGSSFILPDMVEGGSITGYLSTNPAVATVDSKGEIKAVKRGRAFIIAQAGDATVAARVEVTDPNNYMDDLTVWMEKKLTDFEKVYDKYSFNTVGDYGNPRSLYFIFDPQIKEILINSIGGTILEIEAHYQVWVDMDMIEKEFASKYTYGYTNSGVKWYSTRKNGTLLEIGISKERRATAIFVVDEN